MIWLPTVRGKSLKLEQRLPSVVCCSYVGALPCPTPIRAGGKEEERVLLSTFCFKSFPQITRSVGVFSRQF